MVYTVMQERIYHWLHTRNFPFQTNWVIEVHVSEIITDISAIENVEILNSHLQNKKVHRYTSVPHFDPHFGEHLSW
jgi:hypothetical protein